MLFPTTLVGSYPQPEWLIDRQKLLKQYPPRVRARELWRIPEPYLAEAQDDATVVAIRTQEEIGIDIVTDGEIRRESYSNRFATALRRGHGQPRTGAGPLRQPDHPAAHRR
jgi:5-methyltetrahydropteroyltriglutamate--homocysteine methyltransferase